MAIKYQYDTGKTILNSANEIIRYLILKWAREEGKTQFSTQEIDDKLKNLQGLINLKGEYPVYKDNTDSNLRSMCINSKSAQSYSSKIRNFLYLVSPGIFEIYNPEKHEDNAKKTESLLNDLAEINQKRERKEIKETVAEVQILARKGQGRFRNDVLAWCPSCPVSGVEDRRLLIASHIKPWSKSSNDERLDGHNGFMFAPHIDALFDNGFISFDEKGKILISPQLDDKSQQALNISSNIQLQRLPEKTKKYLQYHRENVYMQN